MEGFVSRDIFLVYEQYIREEEKLREKIMNIITVIEDRVRKSTVTLQIIHSTSASHEINQACLIAKEDFQSCALQYKKLAGFITNGEYYRFSNEWKHVTRKLVCLIALTFYLEAGNLVSRETAAEMIGVCSNPTDGFHLDVEDFLLGLLDLTSELSRLATNSVTLGDFKTPLKISRFVADLNSGFRTLNLKNDNLRKRYDVLKYDIKKIEEIVYDISIRKLQN